MGLSDPTLSALERLSHSDILPVNNSEFALLIPPAITVEAKLALHTGFISLLDEPRERRVGEFLRLKSFLS